MIKPKGTALEYILAELGPIAGKVLLDIGCGKGGLSVPLQKAGAVWHGLDPFAEAGDLAIDRASAEAMPYQDEQFDAAICVNSLHHVPMPAMGAALDEIARVLRVDGRLVVIEPKATGALSRVVGVVDDETEIRGAAQAAMDHTAGLVEVKSYDYARTERYTDFAAFCATLIAVDPMRAAEITAHAGELERVFEEQSERDGAFWTLSQPMSLRVFRPV